jgi:hypothetical protein
MEGTNYFDVRFIAGIDNLAKVWVAHSEYTISKNPIAGEQNTIWDCRYESGIPKKRKKYEDTRYLVFIVDICNFG